MEALRICLTHTTAIQFQIQGWYSNRTVQTIDASSRTMLGSHTVRGTLLEGSQGIGVINLPTLERELKENPDKQVGQLVDTIYFPHVHSDQSLDVALERMPENRL
jgi:hypothetical protein